MRKRAEGWNVVLAGYWNRMIFTPEWVAERVFSNSDFETYVALLPVLPVVFKGSSVAMEVSLARLMFRPIKVIEDNAISSAEAMARSVLMALPETPVQAVGINFSYLEDFPLDPLKSVFNDDDPTELSSLGWQVKERKLTRRLVKDGVILNLAMTYDGSAVTFDLNYHFEANTNEAAQSALTEGRVLALSRQGRELLQSTYNLDLEDSVYDEDA